MDFEHALDVMEGAATEVDLGGHQPTYPDFPREVHERRYARLAALMEDQGVEALILTQEESIRYLSGYNSVIWAVGRWLPGAFIATRDPKEAILLPSAFDLGAVGGTSWVGEVDGHDDPAELPGKIGNHLDRLGVDRRSVAFEQGPGSIVMLPWSVAAQLAALLPEGVPDASQLMSSLRMIKGPEELDRIRRIVAATVAGYRAGLEAARAGMTEKELVAVVSSTLYREGGTAGTRPNFINCVAGPDRYPLVDSPASDRPLQSGDVVFLDGGAGGDGYMSDIIRLIGVGDLSPESERHAETAAAATAAMVDAVRPGISASELFQAGQEIHDDAGVGEHAGGLFGHGIGMEIWERPFLRPHKDPSEDIRLRPGMTLCLEPILVPPSDDGGLAGVFVFEQQVAVTDNGAEVLSEGLDARLWRAPA